MRPLLKIASAPLQQTSLSTGNMIAVGLLILCAGFALGWIALATYWASYCIKFA